MHTFYRTTRHSHEIKPVQVVKFTDKTVLLAATEHRRESRENLSSSYHIYHPTYAEARQYLIERDERRLEEARRKLQQAEQDLATSRAIPETQTHTETDV